MPRSFKITSFVIAAAEAANLCFVTLDHAFFYQRLPSYHHPSNPARLFCVNLHDRANIPKAVAGNGTGGGNKGTTEWEKRFRRSRWHHSKNGRVAKLWVVIPKRHSGLRAGGHPAGTVWPVKKECLSWLTKISAAALTVAVRRGVVRGDPMRGCRTTARQTVPMSKRIRAAG